MHRQIKVEVEDEGVLSGTRRAQRRWCFRRAHPIAPQPSRVKKRRGGLNGRDEAVRFNLPYLMTHTL